MLVVPEWIEQHCVIPDGFRFGQPFELYDYQLRYFAKFYLVKGSAEQDLRNPVLAPAFRYVRGMLVGPQKLGKSPHTAAHICVEGVGPALFAGWAGKDDGWSCADRGCGCGWEYAYEPGEPMGMRWPTPLIQVTAFSKENTDNTYDALRPMIDNGSLADLVPATGEEFIRLPGGGRIDTVTSSALSRLGQRLTFAPQDEVGVWTARNKMRKVADAQWRGLAGMGGRASLTTNAWDPTEESVAQVEADQAEPDVYIQAVWPPKRLKFSDPADRQKIFRVVYPAEVLRQNGGHVDLDSIDAEARKIAKRDPAQAARFYGNVLASSAGSAVDVDTWAKVADPTRLVRPGARIGVGFDGSITEDSTGLVCCTEDGHLFVPTVAGRWTVWERPEDAPEGWRVPRLEVWAAVRGVFSTFDVGRMFGDPPKWWTEMEEWAEEFRLPDDGRTSEADRERVLAFDTAQPARMAPACDRYSVDLAESAAAEIPSGFTHDGNPVLTRHVLAMQRQKAYVKAEDPHDGRVRYVFGKGPDGLKIDVGVASVLARMAAATMPAVVEEDIAQNIW